jgi:PAS domain S-box-containing protein
MTAVAASFPGVLDVVPDAIVIIDSIGSMVEVNEQAIQLFGYARPDLVGQPVELLIPERFHQQHLQHRTRFLSQPKRRAMGSGLDLWGKRRDGSEFEIEISLNPIRTAEGLYVASAIRDVTERKSAERERLASLIDATSDAIIGVQLDGVISHWSTGAIRMFNYAPEEVIGRSISLLSPEEPWVEQSPTVQRLAQGEPLDLVDARRRRKDGSTIHISLTMTPIRDAAQATIGVSMVARDITVRKLEENRLQLAAIVDSSDDAIIGKTNDGIITSWNPGAEKMFGFSAGEAIGRPILMCIPPERAGEETHILNRIMAGKCVDHFDTRRRRKDGRDIDVSITVSPIRDASGTIIGASKIARDITQRANAERRLLVQLARLHLLNRISRAIAERQDLPSIFQVVVNSLEDDLPVDFCCACLLEPPYDRLTIASIGAHSQAMADSLSLHALSTIPVIANGLSCCLDGQLIHEPDLALLELPLSRQFAAAGLRSLVVAPLQVDSTFFGMIIASRRQPQGFTSGDCEFLRQLGDHVALAAHQSQLHTSLQQAYHDLHRSQQAAMQQERLRALGEMAAGIAHDINNALSPVALYSEWLLGKESGLSDRARKYLEIMYRSIDDVASTIARLGEFYRQRPPQLALEAANLNLLVQHVIDLTRARWNDMPQQRGLLIRMVTSLDPALPAIMGVASEVREALTNLVFNAVDAMPDGGTLTLATRTTEARTGPGGVRIPERVLVEICDTGIGMDEETRRRCLEPFFSTKGERGSGLGLAMVYGMARRHHAEIEIDTEVNRGTTMRLSFAIPHTRTEGEPPPLLSSIPARLRLLVIDDDPILLNSLRTILEDDGHQVVAEHVSTRAIELFRTAWPTAERFSAVITDLGMPHCDGRQVASAIKDVSATTPVILLTGWGRTMVADGELPMHVDYVLAKPPKLAELRQALMHCCPPPLA